MPPDANLAWARHLLQRLRLEFEAPEERWPQGDRLSEFADALFEIEIRIDADPPSALREQERKLAKIDEMAKELIEALQSGQVGLLGARLGPQSSIASIISDLEALQKAARAEEKALPRRDGRDKGGRPALPSHLVERLAWVAESYLPFGSDDRAAFLVLCNSVIAKHLAGRTSPLTRTALSALLARQKRDKTG